MSGYLAGCAGKQQSYGSWSQAERVAQRLRRDRGNNAAPYRCSHCGSVHLGTGLLTNRADRKARIQRQRKAEQRWAKEWE